jgi:hypothetical protein
MVEHDASEAGEAGTISPGRIAYRVSLVHHTSHPQIASRDHAGTGGTIN